MRSRICILVLAVVMMGLVGGCKKKSEIMQAAGWDKEFILRPVSISIQGEGTVFFHVDNVSELWMGDKKLKVVWGRDPNEMNVTDMKLTNMHFVIDEKKETPTIKFVFFTSWLNQDTADASYESNVLYDHTSLPNNAIYGATVRLNQQHYIEVMLALIKLKGT